MFSTIDGGFQFAIQGLFTMDLSWLFMSCLMFVFNIVFLIKKCVCWVVNKYKEQQKDAK